MKKQVDKSHYSFSRYVHKRRWMSIWHQIDEVLALNSSTVLEIGPGIGLFKALASHFGIFVKTVDIDPELNPDYVTSADDLPFNDNSYDCVCAFQILEHLPYERSLKAFSEMARVADKNIVISIPDAKKMWAYSLHIPFIGNKIFHISLPGIVNQLHKFDGEHYWEINKSIYTLEKIIDDFTLQNTILKKTYRVPEHPFHRFFIFEINSKTAKKL